MRLKKRTRIKEVRQQTEPRPKQRHGITLLKTCMAASDNEYSLDYCSPRMAPLSPPHCYLRILMLLPPVSACPHSGFSDIPLFCIATFQFKALAGCFRIVFLRPYANAVAARMVGKWIFGLFRLYSGK